MRPLLLTLTLIIASTASAQQGGVWMGGPYQQSRVAPGYLYYNHSAPIYPVAGNPFGSYGYNWQQQMELRRLRWAVEDASLSRRWGR